MIRLKTFIYLCVFVLMFASVLLVPGVASSDADDINRYYEYGYSENTEVPGFSAFKIVAENDYIWCIDSPRRRVLRYNQEANNVTNDPVAGTWKVHESIYPATDIAVTDDAVWFVKGWGMVRMDKEDGSMIVNPGEESMAHTSISQVETDSRGNVWAAANDGTNEKSYIMRYIDKRWDTIVSLHQTFGICSLTLDDYNGLWYIYGARHMYEPLIRYDITTGENTVALYDIGAASDGTCWMSGYGRLFMSPGGYDEWTEITEGYEQGITTTSYCEDADGTMYFGTDGGGVYRFDGDTWSVYTVEDGLADNSVNTVACDGKGAIWIGTPNGVSRFNGINWLTLTAENSPLLDNEVKVIVAKGDELWFGSWGGIVSFSYDKASKIGESAVRLETFVLNAPYPNPFNISSTINFSLPEAGFTTLNVYNMAGQKVRTLLSGHMTAGLKSFVWDGKNDDGCSLGSGLYICRLSLGGYTRTGKLMLMK